MAGQLTSQGGALRVVWWKTLWIVGIDDFVVLQGSIVSERITCFVQATSKDFLRYDVIVGVTPPDSYYVVFVAQDETEARVVHRTLCDLVEQQDPAILGGDLGQVSMCGGDEQWSARDRRDMWLPSFTRCRFGYGGRGTKLS